MFNFYNICLVSTISAAVLNLLLIFLFYIFCFRFLFPSCKVTLADAFTQQVQIGSNYMIAQLFPNYEKVTLSNNCSLTCRMEKDGHGGILAFRAKIMNIDGTSKILNTGTGMLYTPQYIYIRLLFINLFQL